MHLYIPQCIGIYIYLFENVERENAGENFTLKFRGPSLQWVLYIYICVYVYIFGETEKNERDDKIVLQMYTITFTRGPRPLHYIGILYIYKVSFVLHLCVRREGQYRRRNLA